MNKSAAGFCVKLHESIKSQFGEDKADAVCGRGVGSSASPEVKGRWAAETMERVASGFNEGEQGQVLAGCACGPGPAQLESFRKIYKKCRSLEEYAERRNEETKGAVRFEARSGLLYVSYPQCYCAMVKNAPNKIPKTWCLCSCEYTRRACSYAFEQPVEVKLLKSVLGGDDECMFEVKIL
jgi:hypothetical protein